MNNIPNKFRSIRYIVDIFSVIIHDKTVSIETINIKSIFIEKDYDNDNFPILKIDFNVDDRTYYDIIKNKETVRFKLRIMKYEYDYENKIRSKKVFINNIFVSFIENDNMELDTSMKKLVNDDLMYTANKSLSLFLFMENELNSSKKYINLIAENTTLTDLITYILSTSGIKKVLLAPLNNLKTYDEVVVPPNTLLEAIDYIENMYDGYYNAGSIKFIDFNHMYFIDKSAYNSVFTINEYKENVLSVMSSSNNLSKISGAYRNEDQKKTFINVPVEAIDKKNNTIINEHITGNNAIVMSTDGTITLIEPEVKETTGKVYKLLLDRYNNKRAISNYKQYLNESNLYINLGVNGVDIDLLTPNKIYTLVFEDSKLNKENGGRYRLSSVLNSLTKQKNEYAVSSMLRLKKIE